MKHRAGVLLLATLASFGIAGAGHAAAEVDPIVALETGNRLAQEGRWDEAIDAYHRGWDPAAPHPTLAYNLGASLHQLDRLPEAILWYRRVNTDDPWVDENLLLARRSLGSQSLPLTGTVGWLQSHAHGVALTAIVSAWLALALVVAGGRRSGLVVAGLAVLLHATVWVNEQWGPERAILLEECATAAGRLPAGTEAWVRSAGEGFTILGTEGANCPVTAVALVQSKSE